MTKEGGVKERVWLHKHAKGGVSPRFRHASTRSPSSAANRGTDFEGAIGLKRVSEGDSRLQPSLLLCFSIYYYDGNAE